jgi:hypothetical protein
VRGEVTVPGPNNTFQQVAFARGVVTAVSETSLSIRSADGTVTTFALNADTKYRHGRQELKRTDVSVNAQAFASGQRSGQTITAAHVLLQPERGQRGRRGQHRQGTPAPAPTPAPTPAPSPGPTTTT